MVAISLYRGNLHRVPNVPRRWLMPTPKISLKDFKTLLNRRSKALSRLHSPSPTTLNPNPSPRPRPIPTVKNEDEHSRENNGLPNSDSLPPPPPAQSDPPKITTSHPEGEAADDRKESNGGEKSAKLLDVAEVPESATNSPDENPLENSKDLKAETTNKVDVLADKERRKKEVEEKLQVLNAKKHNLVQVPKQVVFDGSAKPVDPVDANGNSQDEKPLETLEDTKAETNNKVDVLTDEERRRKEIQEKLEVLNSKKHNLVQFLKQILNAEEELKRRSSTQGTGVRPPVQLQADATNDSGSLARMATPRLGSEGNLGGDNMEGAEADDASNHNMHSRHLFRMSSISPRSDSPHRRPALSALPHPSRASLAVAGSPSRFAPTAHQGHPANLPTVSISGTSYIASSPSPAASGGTSSFRDARLPSPWN